MKKKLLFTACLGLLLTACDGGPVTIDGTEIPPYSPENMVATLDTLSFSVDTATGSEEYTMAIYSNDTMYMKAETGETQETWIQHADDETILTEFDGSVVHQERDADPTKTQYDSLLEGRFDSLFTMATTIFNPIYEMAKNSVEIAARSKVKRAGGVVTDGNDQYTFTLTQTDESTNINHEIHLTFKIQNETLMSFDLNEKEMHGEAIISQTNAVYNSTYNTRVVFTGEIPEPAANEGKTPILGSDLPDLTTQILTENLAELNAEVIDINGAQENILTIHSNNVAHSQSIEDSLTKEAWYQYVDGQMIQTVDDGSIVTQVSQADAQKALYNQAITLSGEDMATPMFMEFLPIFDAMKAFGSADFANYYDSSTTTVTLFVYDNSPTDFVFTLTNQEEELNAEFTIVNSRLMQLELTRVKANAGLTIRFQLTYGYREPFSGEIPEPTYIDPRTPITGADLPALPSQIPLAGVQSFAYTSEVRQGGAITGTINDTLYFYQDDVIYRNDTTTSSGGGSGATENIAEMWMTHDLASWATTITNANTINGEQGVSIDFIENDGNFEAFDQHRGEASNEVVNQIFDDFLPLYNASMSFGEPDFAFPVLGEADIHLFEMDNTYYGEISGELYGVPTDMNFEITFDGANFTSCSLIVISYDYTGEVVQKRTEQHFDIARGELPVFDGAIPDPEPVAIVGADLPIANTEVDINVLSYSLISDITQTQGSHTDIVQGKNEFQQYGNNVAHCLSDAIVNGEQVDYMEQWMRWQDGVANAVSLRDGEDPVLTGDVADADQQMYYGALMQMVGDGFLSAMSAIGDIYQLALIYGTPEFDEALGATSDGVEIEATLYDLGAGRYNFFIHQTESDSETGATSDTTTDLDITIVNGRIIAFHLKLDTHGISNAGVSSSQVGDIVYTAAYGPVVDFAGTFPILEINY